MRLALLRAQHAHERLAHARTANDLAADRYKLGASSITELTQAQLNLITAEIAEARAKYDYLLQHALVKFQAARP